MRRNVIFLLILILLYLGPALTLKAVYGPSYNLLLTDDEWKPDGEGGWVKVGEPSSPRPDERSVQVPFALQYIPILLPGLVLVVVLLTPLSRVLDTKEAGDSQPAEASLDDIPVESDEDDKDKPQPPS